MLPLSAVLLIAIIEENKEMITVIITVIISFVQGMVWFNKKAQYKLMLWFTDTISLSFKFVVIFMSPNI